MYTIFSQSWLTNIYWVLTQGHAIMCIPKWIKYRLCPWKANYLVGEYQSIRKLYNNIIICDDREMEPLSSVATHRWEGNDLSMSALSNRIVMQAIYVVSSFLVVVLKSKKEWLKIVSMMHFI